VRFFFGIGDRVMKDENKTKEQLIEELEELRSELDELREQVAEVSLPVVERRLAVERVRAEAMAMRSSDDILKVVTVMWKEIVNLDISACVASIAFINEETNEILEYFATENPGKYGISWTSPHLKELDDDVVVGLWKFPATEYYYELRSKREVASHKSNNEDMENLGRLIAKNYGLDRTFPWFGSEAAKNLFHIPFNQGCVAIRGELAEEHILIIQELTEGLSLGYLRFLDFQKLEEQNQEIQENTRRKSEFLARMSHDLRTPMNAIIGYTRLLLRKTQDKLDERQLRNLENIDISAHNLLALINEILDLSRVEAGRIDVHLQPVDLQQLAVECVAAIEPLIQAEVQLIQDIEAVPSLRTDGEILRKVLMNLLGNAVKFTDAGSITISVKSIEDQVEISVADTGMGIPSEDLPDIFEEFRQVERQGSTEKEGTGLGLAIARKSVELLGGTISAESEVGKGTTFMLRIKDYPSE